jgi:hypothetical protein
VETVIDVVTVQVQQPTVNGVIEIMDEHLQQHPSVDVPMVNGDLPPNVVHQQQAVIQQQPPLFDMDLEKMHTELYKGRYLTPQDFLDDVGKMVHNADVRSHEDLDRLYKAQAMFTAAQVSIQEFDPQLKLECERMAVRERKRREERRKEKEKERGKEKEKEKESEAQNGNGNGQGARRSARNNGLQPELTITDPVKLERRLKRQRPNEAGSDSHVSEEEGGEGREAKRSRMLVDGDGDGDGFDDRDPLDIVGLSPSPIHHVQPRVHFAAPVIIQPIPRLGELLSRIGTPPQPVRDTDTNMLVDSAPASTSRPRSSGFDPSLLNPLSPSEEPGPFFVQSSTPPTLLNGTHQSVPVPFPISDPENPFLSSEPTLPTSRVPSAPSTPTPQPLQMSKSPEPEKAPSPPVAMVVERPPTPLPDFHVDDELVVELRRCLRDDTADLTVEELEQLRATCLGNVWRHRTEWDRDALVKELLDVTREFLAELDHAESL